MALGPIAGVLLLSCFVFAAGERGIVATGGGVAPMDTPMELKYLTGRVYFWAPGSGPTLGQCHETSRLTDIHGDRADFASGEDVVSFFIGSFWRKKGLLAFWEGALSPAQKSLPQKVKRTLFRENEPLK